MESRVYLGLKVMGEINRLEIDDVRTCGGHGQCFRNSELTEW